MISEAASLRDVRLLVVGDSGVGKTSFINRLCVVDTVSEPSKASWTVGCDLHILLRHYMEESFMIEFFDVGGAKLHRISRSLFYKQINGIILVFDLTNSKSFANLRRWIEELVQCHLQHPIDESQDRAGLGSNQHQNPSSARHELGRIPILIVGTKLDVDDHKKPRYDELYNTVKAMGIDSVFLTSVNGCDFNALPVLDFIDQVIKSRYYPEREPSAAQLPNRRVQDRNQIVVNFGSSIDAASAATSPFGTTLLPSSLHPRP